MIVLDDTDQLDYLIYDPDIAIGLWFTSLSGRQVTCFILHPSLCVSEKLIRNSRNLHFLSPEHQYRIQLLTLNNLGRT